MGELGLLQKDNLRNIKVALGNCTDAEEIKTEEDVRTWDKIKSSSLAQDMEA